MKPMQYNGYLGSVDYSLEDKCLHGKILHINDLVTFEAEKVSELEQEFRNAVDDYLATCKKLDREPDKPFKGTFNVRMTPEQHRAAAVAAALEETTLNDYVSQAVAEKLRGRDEIHHHHIQVTTPFDFAALQRRSDRVIRENHDEYKV